eukprot:275784-Rhodomonas_salina.1
MRVHTTPLPSHFPPPLPPPPPPPLPLFLIRPHGEIKPFSPQPWYKVYGARGDSPLIYTTRRAAGSSAL